MKKIVERGMLIHSGKANNVYSTNHEDILELEASDRISSGNGERKDIVEGKGEINNAISMMLFKLLEEHDIATHFICEGTNSASKFVKKLDMLPLEVINRRETAGSFAKRYGCATGIEINPSLVEFCIKDDELGDPFVTDPNVIICDIFRIATEEEIEMMIKTTKNVSYIMSEFFTSLGIHLIDFKIEFGRDKYGNIVIGDEISPDTCRLVDIKNGQKLDKDVFRNNMGDVKATYKAALKKIMG